MVEQRLVRRDASSGDRTAIARPRLEPVWKTELTAGRTLEIDPAQAGVVAISARV